MSLHEILGFAILIWIAWSVNSEGPKLSLVAQFDDICRLTEEVVPGAEEEFIACAYYCHALFKRKQAAEEKIRDIQKLYSKSVDENKSLDIKLKHAKNLAMSEMEKVKKLEREKRFLDNKVNAIADLLLSNAPDLDEDIKSKIASLSTTTLNSERQLSEKSSQRDRESLDPNLICSDISFDDTADDVDLMETRHTESMYLTPILNKSPRNLWKSTSESSVTGTKRMAIKNKCETMTSMEKSRKRKSTLTIQTRLATKLSRSRGLTPNKDVPTPSTTPTPYESSVESFATAESAAAHFHRTNSQICGPTSEIFNNRMHEFNSKVILSPQVCLPCGRHLKLYRESSKCLQCKAMCHQKCQTNMPLPCVPMPKFWTRKGCALSRYAPVNGPMVPTVILQCVQEVDRRGLKEVGLYNISAAEKDVNDLLEKFWKGKIFLQLNNINIHVICGAIRHFLKTLADPLIPKRLWIDLVEAVGNRDHESAFYAALNRLPRSHLHTLAFLLLHLHKVVASPYCKMSRANLIRIFEPLIAASYVLGSRVPSNPDSLAINYQVMHLLFDISTEYWKEVLYAENNPLFIADPLNPRFSR